jgi:two-component system sensor histidine kinase/response regulator
MRTTETVPSKILVVDDNEANRALAKSTLEDEGYGVVLAEGGVEGITAFERERPDCVLLDIRMPQMDGFEVSARMRSLPDGIETPILFLTALRDVDTFDHVLRAGGDDFLTKPIRPTELVLRVQSALRLRRLNLELREQYDLLKHQRDDLLRLQLLKERLTAFVIHDLKNPVNTLDLFAQILQRHTGLPADARESVAGIRTAARALTRMISNLLDISKADEGQLAPALAEVDLRALIAEVMSDLGVNAESRDVGLDHRIGVGAERVFADKELLERVLTNLVENAIRYAPPKTCVTLTVARRDEGVELRVADAGRGIAPEMIERVFDAFLQVDSGSERLAARGGRGLGLTFCKRAVEAHGGRIWVEDAGPGAMFCVRLPSAL